MQSDEDTTTKESQRAGQFPGDLRDYFAGQALNATIMSVHAQLLAVAINPALKDKTLEILGRTSKESMAADAYKQADAMLKERQK